MGLWNWLGRATSAPDTPPRATFSESTPKPIDQMWLEMRTGAGPVSRTEALSVPAVLKARNMLCAISALPVVQKDMLNNIVRNPLLEQFDPDVANIVHLAQTVEDLLFESIAWWRITGFGFDGYPMTVRRLLPSSVSLEPPGGRRTPAPLPSGQDPREAVVYVDGEAVSVREIIRFDSPNPAVLTACARSIRRAIRFDKAAERYSANPAPLDYFSPSDGVDPAEDDEIEEILADWRQARQVDSTAYVPAALTYNTVSTPTAADRQLVELQKQVGIDLANALGVDPEDLGVSTTSRSYANINDRRKDRINDILAPYMLAVSQRLSMGDVTKRGYRVEFDLTDYMKSNPTERWMTYEKGKNLGVYTADDIRQMEGLPPLPADQASPPDNSPDPAGVPAPQEDPTMVNATEVLAGLQFDDDGRLTFADVPVEHFSVDATARTIEGVALPYGKVGVKAGLAFRFERGSLQWSDVSRVKLLMQHDMSRPIGVATDLKDTPQGLKVKFKVARGTAGDEALQMAEDGVLDGLSVGVDFDFAADTTPDPRNKTGVLVRRGDLREVSLTPMPAFDDARVTRVAASRDGGTMDETATSGQAPAAGPATDTPPAPTTGQSPAVQFSAEQIAQLRGIFGQPEPEPVDERPVVNPTRLTASVTREALPYRFDRGGNFVATDHEFSADIRDMLRAGDEYGQVTDAGKRVMGLLRAAFDTDSADINELNPTINRQDMYVDQRDYMYPLWNAISKGAPPNGVNPFAFPKFNSASGLVGDHTEGTEPTAGSFTTTGQTVTPTALSGKASITREVYDMGGNPAVSTLIYNQMVRGYREGLESATATFLNTLTAATDINLGVAVVDDALADAWDQALAGLAFVRGYDFSVFAIEQVLYKAFVGAEDSTGRRLYPILNPQNATGTAASRFRQLDLSGVVGTPSWALASTPGAANNSWLFDPSTVSGWATVPQRLEFAGTNTTGGYAPVAMVDIAIWGYKAFANSDIGGVRQVIYDSAP